MLEHDIQIKIKYGSEAQYELMDKIIRVMLDVIGQRVTEGHKKNKYYKRIEVLKDGVTERLTTGC